MRRTVILLLIHLCLLMYWGVFHLLHYYCDCCCYYCFHCLRCFLLGLLFVYYYYCLPFYIVLYWGFVIFEVEKLVSTFVGYSVLVVVDLAQILPLRLLLF